MSANEQKTACFWREDIESLAFRPAGHEGLCVVHRRAFRTLLGFEPTPENCLAYFEQEIILFQRTATEKIERKKIDLKTAFHLNSRDIRRAIKSS
ncbi:MAG: hypothetical protein JWM78_239 [Verrucomicrobiaceae bacterium]|nr:hypothetical protein [Verrucomicrobiaceae bacterium]